MTELATFLLGVVGGVALTIAARAADEWLSRGPRAIEVLEVVSVHPGYRVVLRLRVDGQEREVLGGDQLHPYGGDAVWYWQYTGIRCNPAAETLIAAALQRWRDHQQALERAPHVL